MKSFKTYRQLNKMDCGPTCLKMIFRYHHGHIKVDLKRFGQNTITGMSLLAIAESAEKIGFRTLSARLTFEQLTNDVPLPCILLWEKNHFVVLTPDVKNRINIADPAIGLVAYSKEDFLKGWISTGSNGQHKGVALLLKPRESFEIESGPEVKRTDWNILLKYILIHKSQIVQLVLGLLVGSVLQLVFPYLTQSIVDTGIATQNLNFIQVILVAQFALFFGQTFLEFIRIRTLLFISTHVNLAILSEFWAKLMRLPLAFFDSKQTGDILQRINDQRRIENFITGSTVQSLFSIFNFIIFSIVLLTFNSTVFAVFIFSSVFYITWIRLFLNGRRKVDYEKFSLASKESSVTVQLIHGMREIKLNNSENIKRWEWERLQAQLFKLNFKLLSLNQYQQIGLFFINQGKNILITFLVAKAVIEGQLTLGGMLAVQYVIGQLNGPLDQLVNFSQQLQEAKISLERLTEIHRLEDEHNINRVYSDLIQKDSSLKISNLSFHYPGSKDQVILTDINVEFPRGKVTAIVGESGSGKTTLLKLLQKFHEDYNGEIALGTTSLKNLSPHYWRQQTGSVMQDGYIFSDTIANNISLGDENPDFLKIIRACDVANILPFIESLPLSFNTIIGMDGNDISTGQKQRLLIARAIYKNPTFFLFDEATNALDSFNEKIIVNNLNSYFEENRVNGDSKTVIVVAHRLSTVMNAHKIVVMENGKITEEGNHSKLFALRGKYYQLVKNQIAAQL